MTENNSMLWMITMALILGVRHGFDLDHLATIDAITRTVRHNQLLSKLVGFLFSLGHGLVVICISFIIGTGLLQSHIPEWFDGLGTWISIIFLLLFGLINIWNVFYNSSPHTLPVGIQSFLANKVVTKKYTPPLIMGIGALFALSFDTISQVALFSLSASLLSGWIFSIILGFFFMLGMMIADGINGLLVSTLIQRADKASQMLSKSLGCIISIFSLTIGCISIWKML